PLRTEEHKTVAVLPDAAAGMDQHIVADQGALDGRARPDVAIPADLDLRTDHDTCADDRARADLDTGADHGQGIDDHAVLQTRRRVDDRGRCDTLDRKPALRPERVAVELAGGGDESVERLLCPNNRDMGGDAGRKTPAHDAGAGPSRGKLI